MKTMFAGKGAGKTHLILHQAAEAQDEGAEYVVIIVPTADHIDWIYPKMVEQLDMSRAEVWLPREALDRLESLPLTRVVGKWRKKTVTNPPYICIDNVDLIPVALFDKLIDKFGDNIRLVTGTNRPGIWTKDLTPWGRP